MAANPSLLEHVPSRYSVYTLTHTASGTMYVGMTKAVHSRIMAHARRLMPQGGFLREYTVALQFVDLDAGTAGDLERRTMQQARKRGVTLMNNKRIWGPPTGRMLTVLMMAARNKTRARARLH